MTNAEREVAEVLKTLGIQWSYEQPVFIWDENKRPRVWAPDFYLVHFGIYLDVCGSRKFNYDNRKRIFLENGHCVIFLHVFKEQSCGKIILKHTLNISCLDELNSIQNI
jgi:hypothetical protein